MAVLFVIATACSIGTVIAFVVVVVVVAKEMRVGGSVLGKEKEKPAAEDADGDRGVGSKTRVGNEFASSSRASDLGEHAVDEDYKRGVLTRTFCSCSGNQLVHQRLHLRVQLKRRDPDRALDMPSLGPVVITHIHHGIRPSLSRKEAQCSIRLCIHCFHSLCVCGVVVSCVWWCGLVEVKP